MIFFHLEYLCKEDFLFRSFRVFEEIGIKLYRGLFAFDAYLNGVKVRLVRLEPFNEFVFFREYGGAFSFSLLSLSAAS